MAWEAVDSEALLSKARSGSSALCMGAGKRGSLGCCVRHRRFNCVWCCFGQSVAGRLSTALQASPAQTGCIASIAVAQMGWLNRYASAHAAAAVRLRLLEPASSRCAQPASPCLVPAAAQGGAVRVQAALGVHWCCTARNAVRTSVSQPPPRSTRRCSASARRQTACLWSWW